MVGPGGAVWPDPVGAVRVYAGESLAPPGYVGDFELLRPSLSSPSVLQQSWVYICPSSIGVMLLVELPVGGVGIMGSGGVP